MSFLIRFALISFILWPALPATSSPGTSRQARAELPPLDEGLASFGAVVAGDVLYIYGGHIGGTHQHSARNLSHRFQRLDLANPIAWQDLGDQIRGLQGLAMVAHGGRVCRLGGLDARNTSLEEEEDLVSIDEVHCYDPESDTWARLPPLPAGRSSHDAVVVEDRIYVVGGWRLRGRDQEPVWQSDMLILDLAAAQPAWRSVIQPFKRRALAVAAAGGKIYACGGLGVDGTSQEVDIFDPSTDTWSKGPELRIAKGPMRGFGVSAFGFGDRVLLSGGDGVIWSLEDGAGDWAEVGKLAQARFFHRLLPHGDRVLFVAGAGGGHHLVDTETIEISSLKTNQ